MMSLTRRDISYGGPRKKRTPAQQRRIAKKLRRYYGWTNDQRNQWHQRETEAGRLIG